MNEMLDLLWMAILLGLYVGVVPVYIGMLPINRFRTLDPRWMTFLLSFTVGVLLFLLIDLGAEAMEGADGFIAAMQVADTATGSVPALDQAIFDFVGLDLAPSMGYVILIAGLALGVLGLVYTDQKIREKADTSSAEKMAWLIALAIGLHNMGEGLAVGITVSAGTASLASALIIGFALHNLSEGIAIVGPLAKDGCEISTKRLIGLGALAGGPTIIGAFIGLSWFANSLEIFFFAIAAGAVLYVVVEVLSSIRKEATEINAWSLHGGVLAGILVMYITSLFVAI
jgi:zinc transporter ZupT